MLAIDAPVLHHSVLCKSGLVRLIGLLCLFSINLGLAINLRILTLVLLEPDSQKVFLQRTLPFVAKRRPASRFLDSSGG